MTPTTTFEAPVLTVTLNPALDVSMTVDHLIPDRKLRASDVHREAGGGGVNVSRVLKRLDVPTIPFVVCGGSTGEELLSLLLGEGLDVEGFLTTHQTRESVAITDAGTSLQYRIVAPGPPVDDADALRQRIVELGSQSRIVVLSGRLPPNVPEDFLAHIIDDLGPQVTTIVDTTGAPLAEVAAHHATMIKPSQRELAELVGWNPATAEEIIEASLEVLALGTVEAVVASRGPSGALLCTRRGELVWFRPPAVRPISTVGAGDSTVAGIAAALTDGRDLVDAVRFGVAAGTATVLTPGTELCRPDDIARFVEDVIVSPAHP